MTGSLTICVSSSTPLTMTSCNAPPSARGNPFIASAGELAYMWGGWGNREHETVFIYHHNTEKWMKQVTKGLHPPAGLDNGGCTISGQCLYLFGGEDGVSDHGGLYELDINNWLWRKVCEGDACGPGKKAGCRIISHQDRLLVVGGYYDKTPSSRQAGANYEGRWTNEVHSYDLIRSKLIVSLCVRY